MLEQINLANVLQRVEAHAKSGLCVIQQEVQWVELYFEEGRLMCVGPVQVHTTLGDRLVEAGVISPQALQEALLCMGTAEISEMRLALMLMDLGYVDREGLRTWAEQQAVEVLQSLLRWSTGAIYFEEHVAPPADRLIVALSITSLLSLSTGVLSPASTKVDPTINTTSGIIQERQESAAVLTHIANAPTLPDASLFFSEVSPVPPFTFEQESLLHHVGFADATGSIAPVPFQHMTASVVHEQAMMPVTPKIIDTSFMQPDMVLMPADLSALREQNPQIALTPDQWQLLTQADGHTSLQMACQVLGWLPERVCRVAGELIVEGLLRVVPPTPEYLQELLPASQPFIVPNVNNGYPGSATNNVPLRSAGLPSPVPDVLPQYASTSFLQTQSQWGNGENGTIFVPGRGWVAVSLSVQPSNVPMYGDAYAYAGVGGGR